MVQLQFGTELSRASWPKVDRTKAPRRANERGKQILVRQFSVCELNIQLCLYARVLLQIDIDVACALGCNEIFQSSSNIRPLLPLQPIRSPIGETACDGHNSSCASVQTGDEHVAPFRDQMDTRLVTGPRQ